MPSCLCHFFLCCRCCSCISGCSHNGTIILSSALLAPWRHRSTSSSSFTTSFKGLPIPPNYPLPMERPSNNINTSLPHPYTFISSHSTFHCANKESLRKILMVCAPPGVLFCFHFERKEEKRGENVDLAMTWLGGALQTPHQTSRINLCHHPLSSCISCCSCNVIIIIILSSTTLLVPWHYRSTSTSFTISLGIPLNTPIDMNVNPTVT